MIEEITIVNSFSDSITLELGNPASSGFSVLGVEGLGPVKAQVNVTEIPSDGVRFNSARAEKRNIVFNLEFGWAPTVEEVRQKTYKFFPLKRPIDIYIKTSNRYVKTTGYVESNEPDIFSSKEDTKISVICTDPYLYSVEKQIVNFSNVTSVFEFPFSNESLTENLIVFSEISTDAQQGLVYTGDVPVGIEMYIHVLGPATNVKIYNLRTGTFMRLDTDILEALTGDGLLAGDDIVISTIKGRKSVLLIRDGEVIPVLNALGYDSVWFELDRGDNPFYYTADSGASNLQFRIEYFLLYEGI